MAVFVDAIVVAAFIIVITGIGAWGVWQKVQSLNASKAKNFASVESLSRKLAKAREGLARLTDAMLLFQAMESKLQKNAESFSDLVNQFERAGLRRLTFAPAVPIEREGGQELVRSDSDKANNLGIAFDAEVLPTRLRFLIGSSTPKSKYWLARRVKSGEFETLSRSAAYFQ